MNHYFEQTKRFKVGDRVQWISQSGSYSKKKEGIVVEVVRAHSNPSRLGYPKGYRDRFGLSRNHESYVVMVGTRPYWPLVKYLKTMDEQIKDPQRPWVLEEKETEVLIRHTEKNHLISVNGLQLATTITRFLNDNKVK